MTTKMKLKDVYVFCDNSNVFIEGQWAAGREKGIHGLDPEFRLDFGQLLTVVSSGRPVKEAHLYGSRPPDNDSLWHSAEKNGWDVQVLDRNTFGKEKGVDMKIGMDITEKTLLSPNGQGVIVLVSGDADFLPVIERVIERGWSIEIWSYSNAAKILKDFSEFRSLEEHLHEIRMK